MSTLYHALLYFEMVRRVAGLGRMVASCNAESSTKDDTPMPGGASTGFLGTASGLWVPHTRQGSYCVMLLVAACSGLCWCGETPAGLYVTAYQKFVLETITAPASKTRLSSAYIRRKSLLGSKGIAEP